LVFLGTLDDLYNNYFKLTSQYSFFIFTYSTKDKVKEDLEKVKEILKGEKMKEVLEVEEGVLD
jgi:hypothetical protein